MVEKASKETPKELEAEIQRGFGCKAAVEGLYAARWAYLRDLRMLGHVTAQDVRNLDSLGRCAVASEMLWDCTQEAVEALLSDEHYAVRACAELGVNGSAVTLH